jgi:hypothetical protein
MRGKTLLEEFSHKDARKRSAAEPAEPQLMLAERF